MSAMTRCANGRPHTELLSIPFSQQTLVLSEHHRNRVAITLLDEEFEEFSTQRAVDGGKNTMIKDRRIIRTLWIVLVVGFSFSAGLSIGEGMHDQSVSYRASGLHSFFTTVTGALWLLVLIADIWRGDKPKGTRREKPSGPTASQN
jgi:hypothetical protein